MIDHCSDFFSLFGSASTFRMFVSGLVIVFCSASAQSATQNTKIYSWRDATGIVHFADRPADSFPAEHLNPPRPFGAVPKMRPSLKETEYQEASQPSGVDVAGSDPSNRRVKIQQPTRPDYAHNCVNAKASLSQLNQFKRIRVKGPNGRDIFLTQDEKRVLIEEAKQSIANNCGKT